MVNLFGTTEVEWVHSKMPNKYPAIGSVVQIIEPYLFVRCGYPLDLKAIQQEHGEEIHIKLERSLEVLQTSINDIYVVRLLEKAICADILRKRRFGGDKRILFEKEYKELKDVEAILVKKKMVCEGRRSSSSYDEPAYFEADKRHCVYTLELTDSVKNKWDYRQFPSPPDPIKIIATRCKTLVEASGAIITTSTSTLPTANVVSYVTFP